MQRRKKNTIIHPYLFSIKIAEKMTKAKMPEPYDVIKAKKDAAHKRAPVIKYPVHDSDDEDHDPIETRKSLKTAEKMMKQRFFANTDEKKAYEKKEEEGTLREEVKNFEEKDNDEDVTKSNEEVEEKKADKEQAKKVAKKEAELSKEEDDAKKKAQTEFLDD